MFIVINYIVILLGFLHVLLFPNSGIDLLFHFFEAPFIQTIFSPFTLFGSVEFIFLVSLLIFCLLIYKKLTYTAIIFALTSVLGIVTNFAVKIIFQRGRPTDVRMLHFFGYTFEIESFSFPSGHTMRIAILILLVLVFLSYTSVKKATAIYVVGIILVALVALSRLSTQAHFFTDVLTSISLSILLVRGVMRVANTDKLIKELKTIK